jgi:hypothetical protein
MRDDLKGRNLTFTEIAKLVGENWQNLSPAEKERYESQAQAIKDKYLRDLAEYKKTPEYQRYMAYLQEFKAKHAPSQGPYDARTSLIACPLTIFVSADKDASKRVRLSDSGSQSRGSPSANPTRMSRSDSGTSSLKGSEPPTERQQRLDSTVSSGESQNAGASVAPPMTIPSPDESIDSPVLSNGDRSPVPTAYLRDLSRLSAPSSSSLGDDQGREQQNIQRHLPSLSDVFDEQNRLLGTMSPSNECNGFHFPVAHASNAGPPLGYNGVNSRGPTFRTEQASPSISSQSPQNPPYSHSRTPADGSLPIHALLASRPEAAYRPEVAYESSQPPLHAHESSFHVEQKPLLTHQSPNGVGFPTANGAHLSTTPKFWSITN